MADKSDMTTFADLGIAFPLYEAPVRSCADHVGPRVCPLCNSEHQYFHRTSDVFWVGPCSECGTFNKRTIADSSTDESGWTWQCSACAAKLSHRMLERVDEEQLVCFRCVQVQDVGEAKDTEFGMVDWHAATSGVTGGVPGLTEAEGFELVVVNDNWNDARRRRDRVVSRGVRIAPEDLRELIRTPRYFSWQGEKWLFCCRRPMIFIGYWFDVVRVLAPADRGALFRRIFASVDPAAAGPYDDEQAAMREFDRSDPQMYVFRCRECERLRASVDYS